MADCCYSGAWVVECARLLDEDDIKCGHAAQKQGMFIKVFAACLPDESAHDKFYTYNYKGVTMHSVGGVKTIAFAEHCELQHEGEACSQTTLGVDFTHTEGCILSEDGNCVHCPTWSKHIRRMLKEGCSNNYLI